MGYDYCKNQLGNLTLLEKSVNIVASSNLYTAKQAECRKSGNYSTKSLVELTDVDLNTSITRINTKLASFANWNDKSIDQIHLLLIGLAQEIWRTTSVD